MEKFTQLTNVLPSDEKKIFEETLKNSFPISKIQTFQGRNIIPDFNTNTMEYIQKEWNAKSSDVFIASYPKTGSTWMAEIIRQILYRRNQEWLDLSRSFPMPFRFIESGDAKKFPIVDKLPFERRIFQTHMTPEMLNIEKIKRVNAKVVYVYRNPKDAIVSWLKFLELIPMGKLELFKSMISNGWENYIDNVLAGKFHMNLKPGEWYSEHIQSWYPFRDNKFVYFVAYENLKQNLPEEIKKLFEFLEDPVDDECATKLAELCGFKNMKDMTEKTNAPFKVILRKGEVGGWKNYFTVSQSERIDAIMEEKLKDTDIKFTYFINANRSSML